jgi:tRNA A37 methylthiotransferase MiaB
VKLYLRTFGCRANQYDSEAVRAMAVAGGAELVSDPALADVAVFNSCAVTAEAEADLRQQVLGLGAGVVAGFPGETDDDHRATMALVASLPFTGLHVFPYSVRPGTAAERLPGRVPPELARQRAAELRALASRLEAGYRARRAGGEADVVVVRGGERREGLTEDYLSVVPHASVARGERFAAVLAAQGALLRAEPRDPSSSLPVAVSCPSPSPPPSTSRRTAAR